MTSPPLEHLQLSSEQVRLAAEFHEAYGDLVLRELLDTESVRRERSDALIEAASAYRLAGQWRLLIDPVGARFGPLMQAARFFDQAGLAFGTFLQAAMAPTFVEAPGRWVRRLVQHGDRAERRDRAQGREGGGDDDLLDHAQQQAYLLLACAATIRPGTEEADALTRFATRSSYREGVVPMGSLAMPVRMFWGLALDLLSRDEGRAASTYLETLIELSRAYARSVDLAMANRLTWFSAAAPVDVADLDVIGTMAMGVRRFGRPRMGELLEGVAEGLPAVARVPLNLGMAVADDDPEAVG